MAQACGVFGSAETDPAAGPWTASSISTCTARLAEASIRSASFRGVKIFWSFTFVSLHQKQ
jgi:hypothetical protein